MNPYLTVGLVALLSNCPLGYIREGCRKFSFAWFFWIHASIPLLIFLRIKLQISPWFIPVSIALAVLGQLAGSRYRRHIGISKVKFRFPAVFLPACRQTGENKARGTR